MKKKLIFIFTLLLCFMPSVVNAAELEYVSCGDTPGIPLAVPQLTTIAYTLLIIGTPIILIIFSIVSLVKAVTAGNADEIMKVKNKLMKKFLAAAVVFFIAGITRFVVSKVSANDDDKNSAMDCINCFLYSDNCATSTSGNDVQ